MEIKKIENCDYVMFPRQQRPGLKPKHVEREAFKADNSPSLIWSFMCNFPNQSQSLITSLDGASVRTSGVITLKETFPSFVLLQALMPQNSRLSILILSKNVSMLFTMLCIGGMSMAQSA